MAHASSWMKLPLALLMFLLSGVVVGSSSAPAAIDWRNNNGTNYVTSVKTQLPGRCDISWAFAAVSVVESALLIKGGWPEGGLDLSEQQVLDCSTYHKYSTCFKGTVGNALRFITTRGGLSREQDYPLYIGINSGICQQWQPSGSMVSTQGLTPNRMLSLNEDHLAETLATHGPVAVTICTVGVGFDLLLYKGGIYNNPTCLRNCFDIGNMAVVGYGTQDGTPYWILKNSWGSRWGERGFLRLAKGSNMCGIVTHPYYFLASNE